VFLKDIAFLFGASKSNAYLVLEYAKYLMPFGFVFMFSAFFQAFVRNDNAPKHAMTAVILGGILNIILDYILIFKLNMGMAGASVATVIGTSFSIVILLFHFLSKHNNMKLIKSFLDIKIIKQIFKSGFSSFLIELSTGTAIFLLNMQLFLYIGDIGVVVYGIISNVSFVALSLFNSVAQAAQPIISINFGAGKNGRVLKIKKLGLITAGGMGFLIFIFGFVFPNQTVNIFLMPSSEILSLAQGAIRLYFAAFILISLNLFYSTYFQAIVMQRVSFHISILRGFILNTLCVFLLPFIFGANAIWIAIPVSELLTFI
jgi:Na+-driven multidrug efflux pump